MSLCPLSIRTASAVPTLANYAILRAEKLKTLGSIGASLSHNYRARETLNADPSRSHLNSHSMHGPQEVLDALKAALPAKRRKDAVLCIEYLVTCSPDSFSDQAGYTRYLNDALAWLRERHGAQNVIAHSIHRDETTPHLVAYVVPIDTNGKLNAKHFLGGKQALSAMQTDFARRVGERHRLERGIERSTARHTTIREWYGALNQSARPIEIPPTAVTPKVVQKKRILPDVKETPAQVAQRLTQAIERMHRPVTQRANLADMERRKAREIRDLVTQVQRELKTAQERAQAAEERAADLRTMYDALAPGQQLAVVQLARRNMARRERARRLLSDDIWGAAEGVARFVRRARQALIDAAGKWWAVAWRRIEREYIADEIAVTSEQQAVRVVLEHSPGRAGTKQPAAQRWLDEAAQRDARRPGRPKAHTARPEQQASSRPRPDAPKE